MLALAFASASLSPTWAADQMSGPGRDWTLKDEVEVPVVMDTVVSDDGRAGLVLVRKDNLQSNARAFKLISVDLVKGTMQGRLSATWISRLDNIPHSSDWSFLADLGQGVQLYRLTRDFKVVPLIVRKTLTTVGTDRAIAITQSVYDFDQAFGVFDYGWANDGNALWYSTAHLVPKGYRAPTVQLTAAMPYATFQPHVSELHVATLTGKDYLVASAPGRSNPHTVIAFHDQAAYWSSGTDKRSPSLNFSVPEGEDGGPTVNRPKHFDLVNFQVTDGNTPQPETFVGPLGGALHSVWEAGTWKLSETPAGRPARQYGKVDFTVGGFWSPRGWTYPASQMSVIPVRHELPYRSDLVRLDAVGRVTSLESKRSLTHCVLAAIAPQGLCIRESLSVPPEVVTVDVKAWRTTLVGPLDGSYAGISPLTYSPRVWTTEGLSASGFIVWPRNFRKGKRYPAIVVTHGYDADDTFAYWALQWSYPVQLWAERGYVVLCINDIPVRSLEQKAAYVQWNTGEGTMDPLRVAQIAWLDHLKIYRQAIDELSADGSIDRTRVGIAGYSRGSQMTNVAVTQTQLFRAASSGDGSFFSPSSYWVGDNQIYYRTLFGGAPGHASSYPKWQRLSPAFRAEKTSAAVLFQSAANKAGIQDYFGALQEAGVPAEFVDFQDETHLFHYPIDRALALEQNLDWFDFWLKDVRDPVPEKAAQYVRWEAMHDAWLQPNGSETTSGQEIR
ncbi:prolyl oligopeptidase family serine peptidase [Asticcacaulis sp.]|uniref:prolyl oligopeptidase family serine peptidase n=1 Tax=Asticcacaulis sp. TaxID=1872648 RepID=UPI002BA5CC35|nr:prolyl oligopeptidase family serine peptidase [Asticcacaulis sp.]HTM82196.1 prolyl oligopeptidase family serine peptidase [Asticcacaulis sp.]